MQMRLDYLLLLLFVNKQQQKIVWVDTAKIKM